MSRRVISEDQPDAEVRFLVPERVRPWTASMLAGMALAFLAMAAMVWHGTGALSLDRAVQRAIGVPDWSRRSSQHLGDLAAQVASAPVLVLASVVLAVAVWRRRGRDWWALALCGISVPVWVMVEAVLKPLVGRRYFGTAYRFPSGHTAAITAVVVVALFLLAPRATPNVTWWVGMAIGAAAMLAVTWGVLVIRAHSPIDAAAGIVLGAGLALALTAAFDEVSHRGRSMDSVSVEGNVPVNSFPQ